MAEYRVEELAAEAGVTVEALRSYQSKGLLPPPRHVGRLAIYEDRHLARLRQILDLKLQGYSLRMITNLLRQPVEASPPDLAEAFSDLAEERLTLRQVADRTRVPPSLLRSLEASGVLEGRLDDPERPYTAADVRAVRMLLALISGGLPIEDFMAVAHTQIEAAKQVAQGATDLFFQYVRQPERQGLSEEDEARQMVAAVAMMLQATTTLVSYNVQRRVLNGILSELERRGCTRALALLRRQSHAQGVEIVPA